MLLILCNLMSSQIKVGKNECLSTKYNLKTFEELLFLSFPWGYTMLNVSLNDELSAYHLSCASVHLLTEPEPWNLGINYSQ